MAAGAASASAGPTVLALRARGPAGGAPVSLPNITRDTTFAELEAAVRIGLGIAEDTSIVILAGFPPRALELEEEDVICDKVRSGDTLTVRKDSGEAPTVIQGTGPMKMGRGKKGSPGSSNKRKATPSGSSVAATHRGANIHTLSGSASSPMAGGGGGMKRGPKRTRVELGSEEDVGELLLAAVARGAGGGRIGQCMRAVFRKAIEKQYDESKAEARVSSAMAGNFTIEESTSARRLGDGASARIRVTFHKGHGHRSSHEDDVEFLSAAQLAGVVGQVLQDAEAREMLKPVNMAGCSPRVFWSLVKHYGGNIEVGLRQLIPTQDWAFLHERTRKLSEKALENQRQQEEAKQEREEQAAAKREARERRQKERQEREAARARAKAGNAVEVITVDDDDDDAVENGKTGEDDDGEVDSDFPEAVTDDWVKVLMKPAIGYKTALELAGADAEELTAKLKGAGHSSVTEEEIQGWISACQQQELDDIMMEVVGGVEDVLNALERVHVATPKDVKLWSVTPGVLVGMLKDELGEEDYSAIEEHLGIDDIKAMGQRAQQFLERLPWLDTWVSD